MILHEVNKVLEVVEKIDWHELELPPINLWNVPNMSKCIQICKLDENKVCVGCKRHIDEIKQAFKEQNGK